MSGFVTTQRIEPEDLKEEVSLRELIEYFSVKVSGDMFSCIFPEHSDRTPSAKMYPDNRFHCFGCGKDGDIFDVVQAQVGCNFLEAVKWVADHAGIVPKVEKLIIEKKEKLAKTEVPPKWVDNWHNSLEPCKRGWLHEERLLTDATIDKNRIGWRGDFSAYAIPFYSGRPGKSAIDVVQFRSTPDSPEFGGRAWHYVGLKDYYRPSVLNRHVIDDTAVIIFIGTLDAQLAVQDGLPAISINGASMVKEGSEFTDKLKAILANTKDIFIIPDNTRSEYRAITEMAELLGGSVRYFPTGNWGKDYTDYKLAGFTTNDFIKEVIGMDNPLLALPDYRDHFNGMLIFMNNGQPQQAYELLQTIVKDNSGVDSGPLFQVVRYNLHLLTVLRDFSHNANLLNVFGDREWDAIDKELGKCISYEELAGILLRWGNNAATILNNVEGF